MNWHHLNSSLRIDKFLFRNWFLSFFWWITLHSPLRNMPPSRQTPLPDSPGLFGNLNLRFVGHAPEALDRVIIEGDVTWFKIFPMEPAWESAELRSYTRATGYLYNTPWPTWSFLHWPLKSYRNPTISSKCYKVLLFSFHRCTTYSWMMIWSYDQSLETARHMSIHLTFNYPTKQIVHSHE